jgi:hypothetical protein
MAPAALELRIFSRPLSSFRDNRPFRVLQLLETGYRTGLSVLHFIAGLMLNLCQTHLLPV